MNITDATINLATQTTILAIFLVSMAFRMRGYFKVHVITLAVSVVSGIVVASFGAIFAFDSASMQTFTNPTMNLATFASHMFLAITSFASGAAVVALLVADRVIASRSNTVAKIATAFWVATYAVGVLFFAILHII